MMASDLSFYRALASDDFLADSARTASRSAVEDMGAQMEIENIITQLTLLKTPASLTNRRRLRAAAQDLMERMSDEQERVNEIVYSVSGLPYGL
jgi:hypothetical protein